MLTSLGFQPEPEIVCRLWGYGNGHSISYKYRTLIQTGVSFQGYLLALITKKNRIGFVFWLGWVQVLRCFSSGLETLSSFLPPAPFFSVDFVPKQALSHMTIWTPAALGFSISILTPVERELLSSNSFSKCPRAGSRWPLWVTWLSLSRSLWPENFSLRRRVRPIQLRMQKSCCPGQDQVGGVRRRGKEWKQPLHQLWGWQRHSAVDLG